MPEEAQEIQLTKDDKKFLMIMSAMLIKAPDLGKAPKFGDKGPKLSRLCSAMRSIVETKEEDDFKDEYEKFSLLIVEETMQALHQAICVALKKFQQKKPKEEWRKKREEFVEKTMSGNEEPSILKNYVDLTMVDDTDKSFGEE